MWTAQKDERRPRLLNPIGIEQKEGHTKGEKMKRKSAIVEIFTLRDPGGEHIHAVRVAAAGRDQSMNTWILRLIETATNIDAWKEKEGYGQKRGE